MFFADPQALQKETIICYVDYKAWRSSPAHSAVYIMLVSALAYITNSIGHVSYPSLLFNCVPFLFAGGILCGLLAHVMFTLKNTYVWADSVKMFRCQYSPGMLVQDASILCLHASLCVSFYARCKAGNCDNEQIPFCNPEEPLDAFPFGHAHFLLMLPLLTRALVNNASFGGTVACWGMMLCALAVSMVRFSLSRGSHFYVGHAGLVLFAIYVIESLNYERYQLCQRTGVSPAEEAHLDSPALTRSNSMPKLIKTGSFSMVQTPVGHICPRPLLGVPYVFVSDLLAPTRFMRDSTKSLMQLMAALVKISASDEDTRKDASTKQVQINAVVKKMDMVLNQAFVCSSLVSMQMNLAGDAIKHDLEDEIRPKSQSVNVSSVLMDCVLIGRTMQKVVSLNVLSVPKNDLIANVLGDTDWIMESLLCMICNSIRMSSPNGTVHIIIEIKDQPIPSKDFNEKVRIDEMEQGRAKSSKVLQFIVDTDGGTAVKNGMTHPVEILGAWVDFMNKEADSRLNLTRNSSSRSNIFSDKVVSASVKSGAINTLSPGDKTCHNGAAGLCMRGIKYRGGALDGSFDVRMGRIKHSKIKATSLVSDNIDFNNSLSVSGGCSFVFTIPYKSGPGSSTVSAKLATKPTSDRWSQVKSRVVPGDKTTSGQNGHRDTGPIQNGPNPRPTREDPMIEPRQDVREVMSVRNRRSSGNSQSPLRGEADRAAYNTRNQADARQDRDSPERQRGRDDDKRMDSNNRDQSIDQLRVTRREQTFRQLPPKFQVAPSTMVMQVANRFDRRGNYGISDSDSEDGMDLVASDARMRMENTLWNRQNGASGQNSPPRKRHTQQVQLRNERESDTHQRDDRSLHERSDSHQDLNQQRNGYRAVMEELHGFKRSSFNVQSQNSNAVSSIYRNSFNSPKSHDQASAVDEAIEMLTKAKEKFANGSPKAEVNPFAIPYKINQKQTILLIIPGNIQDSKDAASTIINGLKDAGKDVQMENNFVYALNMLLNGASYDAIVMDISHSNTFEATEFVRRLRAWEKTLVRQGNKEMHQFVAAITLDDLVVSADNELHSGVDTIIPPPVKVTAIMDILNIIKILSVN